MAEEPITTKDTKRHKGIPSCVFVSFVVSSLVFVALFFFRRQSQAEHGNPAFPGNIDFRVFRTGQIQRLAMLAAVDFGILAPRFLSVATGLLDHIRSVEPALQMSAAELAFLVLLVAGTLSRLLNLDLVMRKLRRSLRVGSGHFARRQRTYLIRAAPAPPESALRAPLYLKISISLRAGLRAKPDAGTLLVSNRRVPRINRRVSENLNEER